MTFDKVLRDEQHKLSRAASQSFLKEASRVAGMIRLGNVFTANLEDALKHIRWCHSKANDVFRASTFGSPHFWEELAATLEADKDYRLAAECWSSAAAATLGHKRTARYQAAEKRCDELADAA